MATTHESCAVSGRRRHRVDAPNEHVLQFGFVRLGGELLLRVRPTKDNIVAAGIDVPYEIHFVRFVNKDDVEKFSEDDERQQALHLKDPSARAVLFVEGTTKLNTT